MNTRPDPTPFSPPFPMTRLVLFDIDGTLIRTGGAGVHAFGRTAELLYGVPGVAERTIDAPLGMTSTPARQKGPSKLAVVSV